jgi:L-lactate utilization protein LutC
LKDFFKKILGIKEEENETSKEIDTIPLENFSSTPELPLDETFAEKFTNSGGKFIYCLTEEEILDSIINIIEENGWDEILSFDESIDNLLNKIGFPYSNKTGGNSVFFTTCEALIANDGSILMSSNQLKGRKLLDLPYDIIILAKAGFIIENRSDGLGSLISRYGKNIPSGITTIKGPNTVTGTNNILDSGSINTSKNIYLLLVE